MSEIFIQNEAIRNKIQEQYFAKSNTLSLTSTKIRGFERDVDDSQSDNMSVSSDNVSSYEPPNNSNLAKSFRFLDLNEGTIKREFTLCNGNVDITKQYTVHICGYMINTSNSEHPFLQYMVQLDGAQFTFPKFAFKCASNVQTDEDEEMTPEHVFFQNECTKHVLEIFTKGQNTPSPSDNDSDSDNSEQDLDVPSISHIYKGYVDINTDGQATDVYVIFDMTGFRFTSHTNTITSKVAPIKRIWATIDELVNATEILGYKVDPTVTLVFYQTPALMHIKDNRGEILDSPSIIFMCSSENQGTTYQNVYNEPATDDLDKSLFFSLIDERINHPILGNFYVFSVFPLNFNNTSTSIFNIKRCVGFLNKPVYLLKELSKTQMEIKNMDRPEYTLGTVIPTIVEYLSPIDENPNIQEQNLEEPSELPKPTELPKSSSTDLRQDFASISNLKTSCIYFQENGLPFWCIKSTLDFTEL